MDSKDKKIEELNSTIEQMDAWNEGEIDKNKKNEIEKLINENLTQKNYFRALN